VLIAAATQSSDPARDAAKMCRKRGRIVLTGVSGLHLSRADFYEKELSFQVSCAYGPGRYDPNYEQNGADYPYGYVRWTAQRNFEAALELMADKRLNVGPLISHRFDFSQAQDAYRLLTSEEPSLGIVFLYGAGAAARPVEAAERTVSVGAATGREPRPVHTPTVGFVGTGAYACGFLIPAFRTTGVTFKTAVSLGGASSAYAARKFGFREATTDADRILKDPEIDLAVIATRHDSHAKLVCQCLEAGKHVFVEKPPAINRAQFEEIRDTYAAVSQSGAALIFMVGFNRRFAPHVLAVKRLLEAESAPKRIVYTVNAGFVPMDHWTRDPEVGGGRVIGEMCHFIDLLRFLVGAPAITTHAEGAGTHAAGRDDSVTATFTYADGSSGAIHYLADGPKSFPKERIDIFCGGKALELGNFRKLTGFGWKGCKRRHLWRQDKGVDACVSAFVDAIRSGGESPIPFSEIVEVMETTFQVNESLNSPVPGE
jgi:predicted dehydrogenase